MHVITDDQRRARLATRHALASRVGSVQEAVEAMTCLHATEPASVHLSAFARAEVSREEIGETLYGARTVVKQLAMRRTLFAFPRELLPAVRGSASARVATQLRARLAKEVEAAGLADRGSEWLARTCDEVLRSLARNGPSTTAELRERLPALACRLEVSPGKPDGGSFPIAPRILSALGAGGAIVRGDNAGDWRVSRPRWTLTEDWLGESVVSLEPEVGYAVLVSRWLRTFGPGTEADICWWLGATKSAVRRALADLGTVEVQLQEGVGHLLLDDLDEVPDPGPWAALLPVLDPTTMGWKQRAFYLAAQDVPRIFDSNGNAGTTAWWGGRIVGCWVQDPEGVVSVPLLHDIGSTGRSALEAEAERLTTWLGGTRVATVYPSALMKHARA